MKRGDVYWVAFDPSVGGEIKKTRPAVIVSNNQANQYSNRCQVVPCTSNIKKLYPYEALLVLHGKPCKALGDQLTTISKLRIKDYFGTVSKEEMDAIDDVIRLQLALM